MAEILITGMEMPKECYKNGMQYCLRFYSCPIVKNYLDIENDTSQEDIYHKRLDGCPLVELPPHGRLIDADALEKHIKDVYCKDCKRSKVMCKACKYGDMIDEIEDSVTIIGASNEKEDG